MAPVRRYLRITKYSVLECRIYLDDPSLAQSWLLNPRNPILPRVIEAIRPLVIPKLREEKERAKKKSAKKRVVKDVVVEDEFEVSVFLTETSTRHSLLAKHMSIRDNGPAMMKSNSSKLFSETNAIPIDVEADEMPPIRLEEDSDEDGLRLSDIPLAPSHQQTKLAQREASLEGGDDDEDGDFNAGSLEDETHSAIGIESDTDQPPPPTRHIGGVVRAGDDDDDDKKKLGMDVSYEGFAIYGRVLCLVVKKRESKARSKTSRGQDASFGNDMLLAGQARMENWIASTQMPAEEEAG